MDNINIFVKIVVFSIHENQLVVLLNNNHLIKDTLSVEKPLDEVAKDIFSTVTHFPAYTNYLEQLYTFVQQKNYNEISIVYYLLLPKKDLSFPINLQWQQATSITKEIHDFPIIEYAIKRLRWKIEYTNVVYSLLPSTFTLSDLQETYEAILGKKLDKRNFRKKILSLDFLESTGQKRTGSARPALMYRFKKRKPLIVKVFS